MSDREGRGASARQYDAMAVDYAADNAESAFNAYYERPAMISLIGEVEGRRVLEVGCGAGPLTAWLTTVRRNCDGRQSSNGTSSSTKPRFLLFGLRPG